MSERPLVMSPEVQLAAEEARLGACLEALIRLVGAKGMFVLVAAQLQRIYAKESA